MKKIWRLLKWLLLSMLGITLLLLLILITENGARPATLSDAEQHAIVAHKVLPAKIDSSIFYDLMKEYGQHKKLAPNFEYQCLLALSHYPELRETPIDFLVKPAFLPLASRPAPLNLLLPWKKRKYLVIISNASQDFFEPILLKNTPFNEQVGIIGHELAHTVYYQDKSALHLAITAYKYQENDFIHQFERATDKRAIAHGLGYQLYDFAFFVRKAFGDSQSEIEADEGGTYLSPKEIQQEMKQFQFYKDSLNSATFYFQ